MAPTGGGRSRDFDDRDNQCDCLTAHRRTEPPDATEGLLAAALLPHTTLPESLAPNDEGMPKPSRPEGDESGSLRRQIAHLERDLRRSRTMAQAVQIERDEFRGQIGESHARVQRLQVSARKAKTDLRTEKQRAQQLAKQLKSVKAEGNGDSSAGVLFLDHEEQFRYEVEVAYAHQIPAGDKAIRPRRDLRLGPDFLASLKSLEGVDRGKVVAVTVQIITDLVNELDSRKPHPLREGDGAAERDVVRPRDGARCMRVALQRKSPSARRLHYWKAGDAIELSRVVKHDDMMP